MLTVVASERVGHTYACDPRREGLPADRGGGTGYIHSIAAPGAWRVTTAVSFSNSCNVEHVGLIHRSLRLQGTPSEFIYFQDENHWVVKPMNSIVWHDKVIGWLTRWLKLDTEPTATEQAAAVAGGGGGGGSGLSPDRRLSSDGVVLSLELTPTKSRRPA